MVVMTDRRFDNEREALIADARPDGLAPHEAEELALLADLLGDPSTWAEPGSGLEDSVLQAVLDAPAAAADPTTAPVVGARAARERRTTARRSRAHHVLGCRRRGCGRDRRRRGDGAAA